MTVSNLQDPAGKPVDKPVVDRRRYFDSKLSATVVQVYQGDFYVGSAPDEVLATVLGSCVSACVRDPVARCGGMNHFLLPAGRENSENDISGLSLRYGGFAMEQLINAVLAAGGQRDRLEIKVFGGANVLRGHSGVGHRNADFVEEFLAAEGFRIAGKHLRGTWPRKLQFFPHSGQVRMREIKEQSATRVFEQEVRASPRPATNPAAGSIELFD